MAEGHDETGTFDPNEGADGTTSLIPHHQDEMRMKDRTSTPMTSTSKRRTQTTSFIDGTPSGNIYVERGEQQKDEIERKIKSVLPNAKVESFLSRMDEEGQAWIKIKNTSLTSKKKNIWHRLLDKDGNLTDSYSKGKFPKTLGNLLGKSVFEIMDEKTMENEKDEAEIKELREQRDNTLPEDRGRADERIKELREQINTRNRDIEALEKELPLRQRIKAIFKKYGFTAFAVITAIATVIGVIVSNLKAGLTQVAKGVGNGLKELGGKLGEILPGMVGAIASFIFRTAGEVIGFLAKNAWLLIVGLVLFAVEQFKNKKK